MTSSDTREKLKVKLSRKFLSYCKHSTMHGMFYFYKCSTFSMKATWFGIVCFCGALTGFLSHKIWEQYVIDPTVTVVESTHHPTSDIAFPAIVLCDSNMVYGPISTKVSDILVRRGFDIPTVELFFETIASGEGLNPHAYRSMKTIHDLLYDIGIPLVPLLDMLDKPCNILLARCLWRSSQYNCSKMFRKVITYKGFCCRFDIDYFRTHAMNGTNFGAYPGRSKALELVINSKRVFPNGTSVDASAEMFIFDALDRPAVMDSSVTLAGKTYFDVSIELSATDASHDVKALPRNVRRCMLPGDVRAGSSFYSGCVSDVLLQEIAKRCKCVPFFANAIGTLEGYAKCTWDRMKCVVQTKQSFGGSAAELLAFQTCFQKCDYVKYDSQVQFFALNRPSPNIDESLEGKGYSELSIHFADRTCMKYRREVLFTWDQMLANVGGIYGLCMGGSIISIIEVVWLLLELISIYITDKFPRKVNPYNQNKMSDNNIFVGSKGKLDKFPRDTKKTQRGKVFTFTH